MVKIVLSLLLILNMLHAQEYKKIAIIPANINYNKEDAEAFAEILYDAVLNSVAEYNFSQVSIKKMYKVMPTDNETLLADKKYQKEIQKVHKAVMENSESFLTTNDLNQTLLMDFSTKKILYTMRKCRKKCPVTISFKLFEKKKKVFSKKYTLKYDSQTCMLADESTKSLNRDISAILGK